MSTKVTQVTPEDHVAQSRLDHLLDGLRRLDSSFVLLLQLLLAILLRLLVGASSYSGAQTPPMYGDFEAQRHWLEITQHLKLHDWYYYDLGYWGLDYPPLTAWHSYVLGKLGSFFQSDWFQLDSSRGMETPALLLFMRLTVLISESLTYLPGVYYFSRPFAASDILFFKLLIHPAIVLIDYGHFQYNIVMLGFFCLALYSLRQRNLERAAIFFVCCIMFKQMGLYYAPVVFVYLLAITWKHPANFISLAATTILAFAFAFGPFFLASGSPGVLQVVHRMFPFGRGLFEDKVANFWCAINVFFKLKLRFTGDVLQRLSLLMTLISILPACCMVFWKPSSRSLLLGSAVCSWGFFLFSFQVHEKTVLVPLLPTLLYQAYDTGVANYIDHLSTISVFSLWPLLKRDGLTLQYSILLVLWIWLTSHPSGHNKIQWTMSSMIVCYHTCALFIVVPGKPDLWTVVNILLCTPVFGFSYLWLTWELLHINQ